jgi:type VI secretion system lysozyme-like protein
MKKIRTPLLCRFTESETEFDLAALQQDIKQNLECLLNTRTRGIAILSYGIDDFMHSYFGNKKSQEELCINITDAISIFENRLSQVYVTTSDNDISLERTLKIRIEAQIDLKPTSVPAVFESCLDITKQTFIMEQ